MGSNPTLSATESRPSPGPPSPQEGGLPGWRFALGVLVLVALELYSASFPGYSDWHGVLLVAWAFAGLAWLLWLVISTVMAPRRTIRGLWRWGAIALVVTATFAIVQRDVPVRIRFELSRNAFESLATELSQGGPIAAGERTLGLYDARDIERVGAGFRFNVPSTGCCLFVMWGGFAWSDGSVPEATNEDHFVHLDGPWYIWVATW